MAGDLRIRTLKVYVPYPYVVFGREVLGELISKVFGSLLSVQAELILFDSSAHPVDVRQWAHIYALKTWLTINGNSCCLQLNSPSTLGT